MDPVSGIVGLFVASLAAMLHGQTATVAKPVIDAHESVLFGGDMMFDRTVREVAEVKGGDFIFSCIDPVLQQSRIVVANLEGPITSNPSKSLGSEPGDDNNYTFTFPESTAALLLAHNISAVNLGNNHILNFGYSGLAATTAALRDAGVGYFGEPSTNTAIGTDVGAVQVAFVGYNEFAPGGAQNAEIQTLEKITTAKTKGYLPIVYAHWGEEYEPLANTEQRRLAHEFVDLGAVAVVGSHPHVVQDHETYKGAPIYYSLGNFIFDQYWDDAVTHGLLLKLGFGERGVLSVEEVPVVLGHDRRTCPVHGTGV